MNILTNTKIRSGKFILDIETPEFPQNPTKGELGFVEGVLYIFSEINGSQTWFPLTNKMLYYVHNQSTTSQQWTITHNLNTKNIIFFIYDNEDNIQLVNVHQLNENSLIINLAESIIGRAVIFAASDQFSSNSLTNLEQDITNIQGNIASINSELLNKSDINHSHNDLYFTETEITTLLNGKLDINAKAVDSELLNGFASSYFATSSHDHNSIYYTQTQVNQKLADLVSSAPETLDTLNELATALGNDPNFATTITNLIGTKLDSSATATNSSLLEGFSASYFAKATESEISFKNYYEKITEHGNTSGSKVINVTLSSIHKLTITGSTTISFSNFPIGSSASVILSLSNASTNVSFTNVKWEGGTILTLSSGVDRLVFVSDDGGTNIYGFTAGIDLK